MKNKLVTKIILVVVSVSILVSVFAISSSAYTISQASAINNLRDEIFYMPGFNSINLKNVSSETDIPDVLTFPIDDYNSYSTSNLGGFVSSIGGFNNVSWSVASTVTTSNYYDSGFTSDGMVWISSTATNLPFDYYEIDSITLADYRFDSPDDVTNSLSCSITLNLNDPELYPQIHAPTDSTKYSLKVNYHYKYYDQDGDFHDDTFDTKIYPSGINGVGATLLQLPYFPKTYYTEVDEFVLTERTAQNPIYTHDLTYLEELVITIDMDGYDINFMNFNSASTSIFPNYRNGGVYTNRLTPSNSSSVGDLLEGSFDLGYKRGKSDGWSEGFQSAVDQGELNPFENVFNAINTFTSWEFIPGISVGVILSIVIGVSLLIAFLKIFAGG